MGYTYVNQKQNRNFVNSIHSILGELLIFVYMCLDVFIIYYYYF